MKTMKKYKVPGKRKFQENTRKNNTINDQFNTNKQQKKKIFFFNQR